MVYWMRMRRCSAVVRMVRPAPWTATCTHACLLEDLFNRLLSLRELAKMALLILLRIRVP